MKKISCAVIDDEPIAYLVESFTVEAGVRELRRKLEKILTDIGLSTNE